ncbi:MAG: Gmad2 immunoglobulin-like domain-containing protein [Candidatus Paceibacterota bacterium]
MKTIGQVILLILVVVVAAFALAAARMFAPIPGPASAPASVSASTSPLIIDLPQSGGAIASPLIVSGTAPGTWYFEASFPIVLVDWDGLIIAESYAQAQSDWMTEGQVPFTAELVFAKPPFAADYCRRGALILKKDNPSGLPVHDAAVEIPIVFQ